ncbi:MAG: hypothetical protein VB143_01660 [Burkholderia sp.]
MTLRFPPGISPLARVRAARALRSFALRAIAGALFALMSAAAAQAFMKHDPSRLKVGATLTVPPLDASGSAVAPPGASAAHAGSAAASVAPSATNPSGAHPNPAVAPVAGGSAPHPLTAATAATGAAATAGVSAAVAAPTSAALAQGTSSAPQARPSSLQQLLALKNRVLIELQLHGIGKPAPDKAPPVTKPAAAPSRAVPAKPAAAQPTATAPAAPFDRTAVIAVGVAAAALILGFAFRRRKRAEPDDEAAPISAKSAPPADSAAEKVDVTPHPSAPDADAGPTAGAGVAAGALTAEAAVQHTQAEPEPLASIDYRDQEPTPPAAEPIVPPPTISSAAPATAPVSYEPIASAEPAAPAAELAAHTKMPDAAEPPPGQSDPGNVPAPLEAAPSAAPAEPSSLTELNELTHPVSSGVSVHEFPADAVSALDSLDMPLPPRSGLRDTDLDFASHDATNGLPDPRLPAVGLEQPESAHLHETGEQKGDLPASSAAHAGTDLSDEDLPFDDEPSQSIPENRPASGFTPFGAAQFGALNLDFDLDLPAGPGATLPPPTEAALDQIARNKLELASEYVELGDLHAARAMLTKLADAP